MATVALKSSVSVYVIEVDGNELEFLRRVVGKTNPENFFEPEDVDSYHMVYNLFGVLRDADPTHGG